MYILPMEDTPTPYLFFYKQDAAEFRLPPKISALVRVLFV